MSRRLITSSLAPALGFCTFVALTHLGSAPAMAGGRTGKGLSKTDARARVIGAFFRCLRGKRCVETKVFRGPIILKEWRRNKRKLAKVKVLRTAMVARVPAQWRPKFKRRWGRYVKSLAAAGFSRRALLRLGMGKSIVTVKQRVALAFTSISMEYRGRQKTEYAFCVLWKVMRRWYVAYVEDSPSKISRFMLNEKPR